MASIAHVAVARYDLIAYDLVTSIGRGGDDEDADASDAVASDEPTDALRRDPDRRLELAPDRDRRADCRAGGTDLHGKTY